MFYCRSYSDDSEGRSCGQLVTGSLITTMHLPLHHISFNFLVRHQITQVSQPCYRPALMPWDFWFFQKLKSPLKWERFQTIDEIQENTTGQLMAIRRTVWGPKMPTLKGTEASLSYVQCFLYLVSPSINVSIFILHCYIYEYAYTHTHIYICIHYPWIVFNI